MVVGKEAEESQDKDGRKTSQTYINMMCLSIWTTHVYSLVRICFLCCSTHIKLSGVSRTCEYNQRTVSTIVQRRDNATLQVWLYGRRPLLKRQTDLDAYASIHDVWNRCVRVALFDRMYRWCVCLFVCRSVRVLIYSAFPAFVALRALMISSVVKACNKFDVSGQSDSASRCCFSMCFACLRSFLTNPFRRGSSFWLRGRLWK